MSDPHRYPEEPVESETGVTDGARSDFSRREMLQMTGGAMASLALGGAVPEGLVVLGT